MADFGRIRFYNARIGESGIGLEISQLGSGTFDHLGMFGSLGHLSAVQVGSFQETSIIVDENGVPLKDHLGGDLPFGGSGYLTNNRQNGPSGVVISGLPVGPFDVQLTDVNVFNPANLSTYPDFLHRNSGTLLVTYTASGVSEVNVFNPKMFAYDNTATIADPPQDIQAFGYEINASGQWFNTAVSGVWQQAAGNGTPILLTNHSNANGWQAANLHYFVLGLSVKPTSIGIISDFDWAFQLSFA